MSSKAIVEVTEKAFTLKIPAIVVVAVAVALTVSAGALVFAAFTNAYGWRATYFNLVNNLQVIVWCGVLTLVQIVVFNRCMATFRRKVAKKLADNAEQHERALHDSLEIQLAAFKNELLQQMSIDRYMTMAEASEQPHLHTVPGK